jgi:predicted nucleotidyltransferase
MQEKESFSGRFLATHLEILQLVREIPKDGVRAIFLFGSFALGKERPTSDIDICILASADLPSARKEMLHSFASRKIHITLFSDLPPAVRFRIIRDGIRLWGDEDLALHRTRVATVREYLHVRPLLERYRARELG